jgi:hypothetical protein
MMSCVQSAVFSVSSQCIDGPTKSSCCLCLLQSIKARARLIWQYFLFVQACPTGLAHLDPRVTGLELAINYHSADIRRFLAGLRADQFAIKQ